MCIHVCRQQQAQATTVKRIIIFLFIIALIIIGVIAFDVQSLFTLSEFKEKQDQLRTTVASHPFRSAAIFFISYVIFAGLSLPGVIIFTLAAGALFGLIQGAILVSFASTIGAFLAFLVARFFLHDSVQERFSDRLVTVNRKIKTEGAFYLLFLRLVPVFPFFLVNIVIALTPIKAFTYYWVSQLGMLPATILYVNAGVQISKISSPKDVVSFPILLAFILLGIFPFVAKWFANFLKAKRVYSKFAKPEKYDHNTIVLGGGSAGLVAAYTTSTLQGSVLLAEKEKMGGDCLNTGCVPSKSILRSAKFIADTKRSQSFGMTKTGYEFQYEKIIQRVHSKIATIAPKDSVERYTELGVNCEKGDATVVSPWEIVVNEKHITAKNIIIATGATPLIPELPGLDQVAYFTTDTIWSLSELPQHLLIIGAGPIGCELGQAFARLGARVTIVHRRYTVLPHEDEEAAKLIEQALTLDHVTLCTNFKTEKISRQNGEYILHGEHENAPVQITFSHLLLATGRQANLGGLDALQLETDEQNRLVVNNTLQTRFPNVYACGDVTSPMQYTHVASHQAWYAAFNALFRPLKAFNCNLDNIPRAVFTDPEIASVGITEKQALAQNISHQITTFPMDDIDRAITDNATNGFIKVITAGSSDKILGACIVGEHASELITEFVLAKTHKLGLNKILQTVHIYPTRSEINRMVAGKWRRRQISPRTIKLLKKFQHWRIDS